MIANSTTPQQNATFNVSGNGMVGGTMTAQQFMPQYDSGWFPVTVNGDFEIAKAHGFGAPPSLLMVQECGAVTNNVCTTRVVLFGSGGYHDGYHFINPVTVTSDSTNVYLSIVHTWVAWGYWSPGVPGNGWICPGGADPNCMSAYYRVLAWR
jgi:hypothetical protein